MKASTDSKNLSAEQIVTALEIETRLKHVFMHITNHEIRSPISSIVNITKLLTENISKLPYEKELKQNSIPSSSVPKTPLQKSLPQTDQTANEDLIKGLELIHTSGHRILEIFNTLLEFITTTSFYEDLKLTAFELEHVAHKIATTTHHFIKNSPLNLTITKNYLNEEHKKPTIINDERLLTQTLTYTMIYICSLFKAGDVHLTIVAQEEQIVFEIIGKSKAPSEIPHRPCPSHAPIRNYSYTNNTSNQSHSPNFSLLTQNIAKMHGHVRLAKETESLELTVTIPKILTFPQKI
ncbi:hypothetical protein COTS27_00719 [Spirochaetota bacterium]|nr:hypothetical protein COTS27_00719 [Spirochaetota bacterium]